MIMHILEESMKEHVTIPMAMRITGRTKITGIFGCPVEHTLSPAMHNAAFEHLGLDCCYLPFLVRPGRLGQAVESLRSLGILGVNVTIPHKEAVLPFLDSINDEARFIGAVNTIVNEEGCLTGYNTDGRGFMLSLAAEGLSAEGRNVLVVGAGGAARAVSYYLSEKAGQLVICNRGKDRLMKLVNDLAEIRKNVSPAETLAGLDRFDIIVNATPLGLDKGDPLPFDPQLLAPGQIVCDLIYKETPLLKAAGRRGCITVNGRGMLLYQGVLAFELWMSVPAPADIMRKTLFEDLGQ